MSQSAKTPKNTRPKENLKVALTFQPLSEAMEKDRRHTKLKAALPHLSHELRSCYDLVEQVANHPHGHLFTTPVNPFSLAMPHYWNEVPRPMDLKTIRSRFKLHLYKEPQQFNRDMELMFGNALLFHSGRITLRNTAFELQDYYRQAYQRLTGQLRAGDKVKYARTSQEEKRRGRSWERGDKSIDREKIKKLLDLINSLSVHKKHQLLRSFNAQYSSIKAVRGDFDITQLSLQQGLVLIKMAARLEPEEINYQRLLGLQEDREAKADKADNDEEESLFSVEDD